MVNLNMQFPENFFKEEEREGYVITSQRKEIWAVELDLLNELIKVCDKYQITVVACAGTLLGAIRHKGFIPWDDDIDMIISREDYKKLCEVAEKEFKYPYFFQTEYTDQGSRRGHAQLRNSQTTGALKNELKKVAFNQGIFIDIFPVDNVIDDKIKRLFQRKKIKFYKDMARHMYNLVEDYEFRKKSLKRKLCHPIALFFNIFAPSIKWYQKLEDECAKYNHINTKMMAAIEFRFEADNYEFRKDFRSYIEVPFEMLNVKVPINYEHALMQRYGNWKKYEVGTSLHGEVIFSTREDYKTYAKRVGNPHFIKNT